MNFWWTCKIFFKWFRQYIVGISEHEEGSQKVIYLVNIFFFFEFIDLNKQAVIYKAKALKQIQINSKGQP